MENEHVISGLKKKRAELAGKIEHHQTVLRQLIIDLDNLDATLRLFVPDIDLEEIKPKPMPPRSMAFKGEVSRIIFETLRDANGPMTVQQMAEIVMAQRGLNTADKKLARAISKRVGAALRHHRSRGTLRSVKGPGSFLLWEIAG
ncbi:MAG: hypothetical protein GEU95_17905 [Rhizobiales bacterium]|nr:hypothetical protein [Hyphomicrobiales bacterium]